MTSPPSTYLAPETSSADTSIFPPGQEVSFTVDDVFVRGCDSQIIAADAAESTDPDDQIGPLTLFGLRDAPGLSVAMLTLSSIGELGIQKYVTTLVGDDAVWLAVAPNDRPYVSLIYDPTRWVGNQEGLPLEAGDPVVRFDGCNNLSDYTQYNGGLLVNGVRCVTFEVWSTTESSPLSTVAIPFGVDAVCPPLNET
ncbi:MAG: hypothetical protein QNL12_05770 [Acidimicrobiia bacterium]|nr:hypothetical protein [Acidimicrobiia bacterium]MDX2466802.1 hypothetical protein [Acidimicrobiia bacterium]